MFRDQLVQGRLRDERAPREGSGPEGRAALEESAEAGQTGRERAESRLALRRGLLALPARPVARRGGCAHDVVPYLLRRLAGVGGVAADVRRGDSRGAAGRPPAAEAALPGQRRALAAAQSGLLLEEVAHALRELRGIHRSFVAQGLEEHVAHADLPGEGPGRGGSRGAPARRHRAIRTRAASNARRTSGQRPRPSGG